MTITKIDSQYSQQIQNQIDLKTKPLGALGQLESLAITLANIASNRQNSFANTFYIEKPTALVFAADHGISDEKVSIAPSDVTRQMVLNFIHGGAAINCFCRANNISLNVIDCGIKVKIEADIVQQHPHLIEQRIRGGTFNFAKQPAMTLADVEQSLIFGKRIANEQISNGCNLLILGEMGIGNTSSAAALLCAITGKSVDDCVGKGTGISDEQLSLKKSLIKTALTRFTHTDIKHTLAEVGGFEIIQMAGAMLAAAQAKVPVLVDGFIVSIAALIAKEIDENVSDYFIFSHQSEEHGHQSLLSLFNAQPLLSLNLRLGEGTGAALALPLLVAASHFYNDMASFEQAGVTID